jgi:HD-GYP domain-containing protein (c-di-GMP phosphodiesterase class II)
MAVRKIAEGSGQKFDPQVVNAFLMLWKRKELGLVIAEK